METTDKINILAISGSLKASSANSSIIRTIAGLADSTIDFFIYKDLDMLPHFNPDKKEENPSVSAFRELVKKSDGVVISTPEYAFGVPGTLKNALDWTVSSGEFNEKPVVAISASPMYEGGLKAMTSLLLTLNALGARMTERSHLSIPNILKKINQEGQIIDKEAHNNLKALFDHLLHIIKNK